MWARVSTCWQVYTTKRSQALGCTRFCQGSYLATRPGISHQQRLCQISKINSYIWQVLQNDRFPSLAPKSKMQLVTLCKWLCANPLPNFITKSSWVKIKVQWRAKTSQEKSLNFDINPSKENMRNHLWKIEGRIWMMTFAEAEETE